MFWAVKKCVCMGFMQEVEEMEERERENRDPMRMSVDLNMRE